MIVESALSSEHIVLLLEVGFSAEEIASMQYCNIEGCSSEGSESIAYHASKGEHYCADCWEDTTYSYYA